MKILFTICGRAGSKGFKNKNLKEMNGAPLVYYTLAAIKGFIENHPDDMVEVAVNTDSVPLIELCKLQKEVSIKYIDRKKELAGDTIAKVEVIKDTFLQQKTHFDVVVDLDITSPLRSIKDIENILEIYSNSEYDLVFSVVRARRSPYFNMVEKKGDGYYRKICDSIYTTRQQAPISYELNASIYAYSPHFLASPITKTILDYRCGISEMPDYLVLDIDSEEDFEMMEALHTILCEKDKGLADVKNRARAMALCLL